MNFEGAQESCALLMFVLNVCAVGRSIAEMRMGRGTNLAISAAAFWRYRCRARWLQLTFVWRWLCWRVQELEILIVFVFKGVLCWTSVVFPGRRLKTQCHRNLLAAVLLFDGSNSGWPICLARRLVAACYCHSLLPGQRLLLRCLHGA